MGRGLCGAHREDERVRAAGSKSYYTFVLRNENTGRYDQNVKIELDSVTSIIKSTLAAPQLVPWAYRVTRDNISGLTSVFVDAAKELGNDEWERQVDMLLDTLSDADMLDEYLKENRLRPDDVRDDAATRGSTEHGFLERLGAAGLETEGAAQQLAQDCLNSDTTNDFSKGIAGWWLDRNPRVVASEIVLVSLTHRFCGSVDLVWLDDDGNLVVTDLKTRGAGKGAYSSDHIQVGAYALAYEEMVGRDVQRTTVLVVREDGTWLEEETTIPRQTFIDIANVYRALKGAK